MSSGLSGATIAAGQSATLTVAFAPKATGSVTGGVSIVSNASNSPGSVALSGSGISATAHYVKLNWAASSTLGVLGYNVYRSTKSGGSFSRVTSTLLTTLSYSDPGVVSGTTYYYVVTAVGLTGESVYSGQVVATVP
jgi:hypothetical protein